VDSVKALVTTATSPLEGLLRVLVATATVLVATLLVLGAGAPAAHAHAELVRTWPAPGATDRPVQEVRLRFGEALAEGLAQVAVTGPEGSATAGAPVVEGSDVVVPLRPLTKAGTYSVAYRVVAADGHAEVGAYDLTVSAASAAAAAKRAAGADAPSTTGTEGAGSASRGSRTGAPEQLLPAGSGAPVASGGLDLALTGGGVAALVLLLGLHLLLRRNAAPAGRTP
jgi:methionine-rich copper-binding protein CopC